jgi:O-antigen/teichoic acid export membrane protein
MLLLERLHGRLREDGRLQRILHGGASGLLAKGSALLVSFISVPLMVHYLGVLEYGVWITISTTVVMLSMLDLGIANTLTNFIAEAYADEDPHRAQHYFATAFWITVGIAAILGCIGGEVWLRVDCGKLFHLTDPYTIAQAREAVAVCAAYFLCSLPLNLANKVLAGYQEVHRANYFGIMNNVFGLLAITVTIACRGKLAHLMMAYCSAMLLGTILLNLWLCIFSRPWLFPTPRMVRWHMSRKLFGEGILFFVLQLTSIVVYNSDNLVIAHYLGADRVTPYSVGWKLMSTASLIHGILVPSLWAALTAAYHKGEMDWVVQTYRSVRRRVLSVVTFAAILLAIIAPWLIRVWAGAGAIPSARLLWLMAVYSVVACITTNQAMLLTATRRLKIEAAAAVLAAVVNVVLSIHWVGALGAEGVMLGTLTSFLTCMVLPQAWEVRRVLHGKYLRSQVSVEVPASSYS